MIGFFSSCGIQSSRLVEMNRGRLFWKSDIGLSALLFVDAYAARYQASISLHTRCYVMHAAVSRVRTRVTLKGPVFFFFFCLRAKHRERRQGKIAVEMSVEIRPDYTGYHVNRISKRNCIWIVYRVLIFYCMPHGVLFIRSLLCAAVQKYIAIKLIP